jgi:non-specific serine/threonine protein kinase
MHQQYEQLAITALGAASYGSFFRRGELASLDQVVTSAVGDADELPAPVRVRAPRPDSVLTGREHEIAGLVAEGMSNREIAGRLVISKRTVDAHIEHIYDKLGISSRVQLATWLRSP